MGNKKPLIITGAILFLLIIIASGAYGVLAYTAQPTNIDNIAAQDAQSVDANQSQGSSEDAAGDGSGESDEQVLAPDFTVLDENGKEVSLSDLRGKPVVINFWTSWCTYCKQEMPDFQKVHEKYGDKVHFMMVNVTADVGESREAADAFISEHDYTFPYYFDTEAEALNAYAIRSYPSTYVVDADGYVYGYAAGMIGEDTLVSALDALV